MAPETSVRFNHQFTQNSFSALFHLFKFFWGLHVNTMTLSTNTCITVFWFIVTLYKIQLNQVLAHQ